VKQLRKSSVLAGARQRVLHLIDTGGPGGAETIFHNVVTGLDRNRWESIAVVPERDWLYSALREHGIDPIVLPTRGSFDLTYALKLTRLLIQHKIAIVHTHLLTSAVYGSLAARCTRIPVVCTFHGTADFPPGVRWQRAKVRAFDRAANRVAFVSAALREACRDLVPLRHARADVVWNGIDASEFCSDAGNVIRSELGIRADETVIGAVGNVRPDKAYDVLLRAADILHRRGSKYRFVIVGDTRTRLYDELAAMRRELGLDEAVVFTGFRSDVARLLAAFNVFVLTSRAEGFSLSTLQALSAGVPVVATRCGGPEDILEDFVTGLLVSNGDPGAIADGIQRIVTDTELSRRVTSGGRRLIRERFARKTMVSRYEAIYEECLAPPVPVRTATVTTGATEFAARS
jgi:glycosyltransferase involved in cell wall biosynthesis